MDLQLLKRTKNTLIYFALFFLVFLPWPFFFFDFSSWRAFGKSLLNPFAFVPILLALYFFFRFLSVFNGIRQYKKFVDFVDVNKYIIVQDGFPGAGKTTSSSEYCVILSWLVWEKIRYDYWLLRNTQSKWQGKTKSELDFKENKESREYWQARPDFHPCLMSSIDNYDTDNKEVSGMTVNGKSVEFFTFEMLNQEERIPYGTVIHLEEIGDWIGNEFSNRKGDLEGVSRSFRYSRHNGHYIDMNDQDRMNIFINSRRAVCLNQLMIKQKWACRPRLLLLVQSFIKWRIKKSEYKDNGRLAAFMLKLDKLIRSIGFRKYWSELGGNTQNGLTEKYGQFVFCIPSQLLASFDDRYKRTSYKPCPAPDTSEVDEVLSESAFWDFEKRCAQNLKYRKDYPEKWAKFCEKKHDK